MHSTEKKEELLEVKLGNTQELEKNKISSLVVQWLGLGAFTAVGLGSIPGQGTKIPQAKWCSQIKNQIIIDIDTLYIYICLSIDFYCSIFHSCVSSCLHLLLFLASICSKFLFSE